MGDKGLFLFKLGEIRSADNALPLYIPAHLGGLLLTYDELAGSYKSEARMRAASIVEGLLLDAIARIGSDPFRIDEIDFGISPLFPVLYRVNSSVYSVVNSEEGVRSLFQELHQLAFDRHRKYFVEKYPDFFKYNSDQNLSPLPIRFVLWNLEHYYELPLHEHLFEDLLSHTSTAGIFLFMYSSRGASNDIEELRDLTYTLETYFPHVSVNKDGTVALKSDPSSTGMREIFTAAEMAGFRVETGEASQARALAAPLVHGREVEESSSDFLRVPIGTSEMGDEVYFSLGEGSGCYHALIAGDTGTGKTTLLNNILLGIAQKYDSDTIRLYLMDYKDGVEFTMFSSHPNVEEIYLDSENLEAALEIVDRFKARIKERNELFKKLHVRNINEYNKASKEKLPHLILVIDEVQQLFSSGWKYSQAFNALLSDVASRGRSAGLHIVLSTQNMLDVDISPRLLSQISLRIAFRIGNYSAVTKILSHDNIAAMDLAKFEFIYNANSGLPRFNIKGRAFPPPTEGVPKAIERAKKEKLRMGVPTIQPIVKPSKEMLLSGKQAGPADAAGDLLREKPEETAAEQSAKIEVEDELAALKKAIEASEQSFDTGRKEADGHEPTKSN